MLKEQGLLLTMVGGAYSDSPSGGGGAGGAYIAEHKIEITAGTPDSLNIVVGTGGIGGGGSPGWSSIGGNYSSNLDGKDTVSQYKVNAPGGTSLNPGGAGGSNQEKRYCNSGGGGGGGGGATTFGVIKSAKGGGGGSGSRWDLLGYPGQGAVGAQGGKGGFGSCTSNYSPACTASNVTPDKFEPYSRGGEMGVAGENANGFGLALRSGGGCGGGGSGEGVTAVSQNGQNGMVLASALVGANGGAGGAGILIADKIYGGGGGGGAGGLRITESTYNSNTYTYATGGLGGGGEAQNGGLAGTVNSTNFIGGSYCHTGGGHGGNGGGGYVGLKFVYGLNGGAGGGGGAIVPQQKVTTIPGEILQISIGEGLEGGRAGKMNENGSITKPTPQKSGNIYSALTVTNIKRNNKEIIRTGGGITEGFGTGYHAPYYGIIEGITSATGSQGTDSGRNGAINDGISTGFVNIQNFLRGGVKLLKVGQSQNLTGNQQQDLADAEALVDMLSGRVGTEPPDTPV